jgi:vancomycin permeability regulator SanA
MDAIGVPSDLQQYRNIIFFMIRDIAASIKAWIDIHVYPPQPPVM